MGGGADPPPLEGESSCSGDDVITELNDAFSDPNSGGYKNAQNYIDDFRKIPNAQGNYQALIDVYNKASVPVSRNWGLYLTWLGKLVPQGPENIHKIAKARADGLTDSVSMTTTTHPPESDGPQVHVKREGNGPITIDSPYLQVKPKS
jgi:hypothetical protein